MKRLAAALLLTAVACGADPPRTGTVTDKNHQAGYMTTSFIMAGKVLVPVSTWHPDSFELVVRPEGGKAVRFSVSESTYDACQVGAHWIDGGCPS